jgi:ATP-dependent 26S proteasome regulatory subunit
LYMLKATDYNRLELDSFPTTCEDMSLELNYGTEFVKAHAHIIDCLKTKKSGLYVFHGPPGTGKTSYIKYLTTVVEARKFIFVPNTMVADLFSPKLVDKLYTFKNSVLVLEDAEVCVFKRYGSNNALVSGILNITDGLLKDLLNISIIVTFNSADISELDRALLRKGRLKVMHEFSLLPTEDARKLAKHLGKKKIVGKPLSLADVYNLDEETGLEETEDKKVGFGG